MRVIFLGPIPQPQDAKITGNFKPIKLAEKLHFPHCLNLFRKHCEVTCNGAMWSSVKIDE